MTDQLRGLLEQAVPDDAPTLDPHTVAAAARRSRNRSRAALAGLTALVVAGGAVAFAALDGRGDDSDHVAGEDFSAPYDAPGCPVTLPELSDATTSVDSLEGLASVRLCPDLAPYLMSDPPPLSEQKAILAGMDAVVGDTTGFARRVAGTEAFDPGRCATIDVLNTRQSLQLTYADGRTVLLPTGACRPVTVAGHEVDGQFLGEAYLAALDHQRSTVAYTYHGTVPLSCDRQSSPGPARPGRDELVAAIVCTPDGTSTVLDEDRLDRLAGEWRAAVPAPTPDSGCPVRTDLPVLVVATDHGDAVRIRQDRCTSLTPELAWTDADLPDGLALTTTMVDLGLA